MQVLIIRHGDPDYSIDSLTERGWKEAELLSHRLKNIKIDGMYCSPLGRAKNTAQATAALHGMTPVILPWLTEFPASVTVPYEEIGLNDIRKTICPWDIYPQYFEKQPEFYDINKWKNHPVFAESRVPEVYETVSAGWNNLISEWGYQREGQIYKFNGDVKDDAVIVLFCHLGVGLAILSQMLKVSPAVMWNSFFMPASSVTTVYTERHIKNENEAVFRAVSIGDVSHLYQSGCEVSAVGLHSPIK